MAFRDSDNNMINFARYIILFQSLYFDYKMPTHSQELKLNTQLHFLTFFNNRTFDFLLIWRTFFSSNNLILLRTRQRNFLKNALINNIPTTRVCAVTHGAVCFTTPVTCLVITTDKVCVLVQNNYHTKPCHFGPYTTNFSFLGPMCTEIWHSKVWWFWGGGGHLTIVQWAMGLW